MATSYGALCTDFYINLKLGLKMDLPSERETILHLCDQVRKVKPKMNRFRRYDGEVTLESSRREAEYTWLSMRRTALRTGHVNPSEMADAYQFHELVLKIAPAYLSISPLDVDHVEVLFGFDLECRGNHDEVVYDALFQGTPLANLLRLPPHFPEGMESRITDVQPLFGMTLGDDGNTQVSFDVKTRSRSRRGSTGRTKHEPLSLFLSLRQYGPIDRVEQLPGMFQQMTQKGEVLAAERFVPELLTPISRQIASSNA